LMITLEGEIAVSAVDLYLFTGRVRLYTCFTAGSLADERVHTLRLAKAWVDALDALANVYRGWDEWTLSDCEDENPVRELRGLAREARLQFGAVLAKNIYINNESERDSLRVEVVDACYASSGLLAEATRKLNEWQRKQAGQFEGKSTLAEERPFQDCDSTFKGQSTALRDELRERLVRFQTSVAKAEIPGLRAQSEYEYWDILRETCQDSRRVLQSLHVLFCVGPSLVHPALVAEILSVYARAWPLMPEGTAYRDALTRRYTHLQTLFPAPVDFRAYRAAALAPDRCPGGK